MLGVDPRDHLVVLLEARAAQLGRKQLVDPAVRARCDGAGLAPGDELTVRLAEADPDTRVVRFAPAA